MSTTSTKPANNNAALGIIISVFFFWGFVAASNGILIPLMKSHFQLSQFQSQLVDFAFYLAYGVGSLIYFLWSMWAGDPLNKIGYKKGLIIGLLISASGALLFVPAVNSNEYIYFLIGLFVIAFGFALLQIVANPFVINLGDPAKGSYRLNLAGSINSLGTSIGPVIFSYALYGSAKAVEQAKHLGIDAVKAPFIIIGGLLIFVALFLSFSRLPNIVAEEDRQSSLGALKYPQLTLGMLAIFIYVGVEVTIGSNLGALLEHPDIKGIDHSQVGKYVSLYWGSLMIGRWTAAMNVFNLKGSKHTLAMVVIPFLAFLVVLFFNNLSGADVSDLWIYSIWIALFILINFMGQQKPARTLILFGLAATVMTLMGMFTKGEVALYSLMSGGLFCSIMWPAIFNLAIAGLGQYTNQGSSLLVMMIFGGAVIPLLQGVLIDRDLSDPDGILGISWTQFSYIVAVVCFLYLAWYGWVTRNILRKQGIDYDAAVGTGH